MEDRQELIEAGETPLLIGEQQQLAIDAEANRLQHQQWHAAGGTEQPLCQPRDGDRIGVIAETLQQRDHVVALQWIQ